MAARLPDEVWLLLADWSAHPGLALLDRRRRVLLWRRIVVGRLTSWTDAAELGAFLADAPVVDVRLRLPPFFVNTALHPLPPSVERLALHLSHLFPTGADDSPRHNRCASMTTVATTAPRLHVWLGGLTALRNLTVQMPRQSLGNAGFVALWHVLVACAAGPETLPNLTMLTLGVAGNGIDDDGVLALLDPEEVRLDQRPRRPHRSGLRELRLDLGSNRLGARGVRGLGQALMGSGSSGGAPATAAIALDRCEVSLRHNALVGPEGGAAVGAWLALAAHGGGGVREVLALDVSRNPLGRDGLEAMVDAAGGVVGLWRRLALDLRFVGVAGGLAGQTMRRWVRQCAPRVRWLDLWVGGTSDPLEQSRPSL